MSAQETAEAVLIVVRKLAKWAAFGIGGLALLAGLAFGGLWLKEEADRAERARIRHETYEIPKSKVEASAMVAKGEGKPRCEGEWPVAVRVINRSDRPIMGYELVLSAKKKGRSSELAHDGILRDDKIIQPGDWHIACWRILKKDSAYTLKPERLEIGPDVEVSLLRIDYTFGEPVKPVKEAGGEGKD